MSSFIQANRPRLRSLAHEWGLPGRGQHRSWIFLVWMTCTSTGVAGSLLFSGDPHMRMAGALCALIGIGGLVTGQSALKHLQDGFRRIEDDASQPLQAKPHGSQNPYSTLQSDQPTRVRSMVAGLRQDLLEREEQLHQLAFTCHLTRLANRQHFHAVLEAHLRQDHAPIAVLLIDLNRFKAINDGVGHVAGDNLLRNCAKRLALAARSLSAVCLARLDGDEFALLIGLLPGSVGDDQSAQMLVSADIVHKTLDAPFPLGDTMIDIRACIGMALSVRRDGSHRTASEVLRQADVALAQAKAEKLPTVLYEARIDVQDRWRLSLLGELRHAMQSSSLALHIQPKMELATGRVKSGEALIRWTHQTLGAVAPSSFIGYAEKTGFIREITSWAIQQGIEQLASLREVEPEFSLSLNLSSLDLQTTDLLDRLILACLRHRVPHRAVTLEITEGAFVHDVGGAIERLHALAGAGFRLSIDDFGTGYSSLSYLATLPLYELKVDQSFVRQLDRSAEHATIARWVVQLGLNLQMHVVAEGVESLETAELLTRWGCHCVQGYAISRPLPMSAFLPWLQGRGANGSFTTTPTSHGETTG